MRVRYTVSVNVQLLEIKYQNPHTGGKIPSLVKTAFFYPKNTNDLLKNSSWAQYLLNHTSLELRIHVMGHEY